MPKKEPLYPHVPKSRKPTFVPAYHGEVPVAATQPRLKAYYTPECIKRMVEFANTYARVPKAGHTIVDVNVAETLIHYPFVAFIQDDGESILTEWF
jgi:hypothetical protein